MPAMMTILYIYDYFDREDEMVIKFDSEKNSGMYNCYSINDYILSSTYNSTGTHYYV